jgi:hypothetical protein
MKALHHPLHELLIRRIYSLHWLEKTQSGRQYERVDPPRNGGTNWNKTK